ncbi:MAG: glycogen-binding domain-containing protein [Desulfobacteraceae bacterium]|nr:glycogen-binding domain-containing protein [Desulfobacteraceae bacterium]
MTTQLSKQTPKRRRIKFTFNAKEAAFVCLSGDFNNWSEKRHVMDEAGPGTWTKTLLLPLGVYEYKFKVDEQWVNDPQNEQLKLNCFGTENNLIQVR